MKSTNAPYFFKALSIPSFGFLILLVQGCNPTVEPGTVGTERELKVSLLEPSVSPNTSSTPVFKVEGVMSGEIVRLFKDEKCSEELGSALAQGTSIHIPSSDLNFGLHSIYANSTDIKGNTLACSKSFAQYKYVSYPAFSPLSDVSLNEDSELVVSFAVSDEDDPSFGCKNVSASVPDESIFASADLVVLGEGKDCSLKLSPQMNKNGSAIVTLNASDELKTVSASFKVTVNPIDDAATLISSLSSLNFIEDEAAKIISLNYEDIDSSIDCAQIVPNVFPYIVQVTVSGKAPACEASIRPLENMVGSAAILFTANNGLSVSTKVSLSISPVEDAPKLIPTPSSLSFEENGVTQNLRVIVSDPDTSTSCSDLKLSPSNLVEVVKTPFGTTPNCGIRIRPKLNAHGKEILTLSIFNGLPGNAPLEINISPVDNPPVISLSESSLSLKEDNTPVPLVVTLSDPDTEVKCSELKIEGEEIHFESLPSLGSESVCQLALTPRKDLSGAGIITFYVNNGQEASQKLSYTISAVDDAPVIAVESSSLSFKENESPQNIIASLSDVDSEVNCSMLQASATSSVVSLKKLQNEGENCSIEVTPEVNQNGSGKINLVVENDLRDEKSVSFSISEVDQSPSIKILSENPLNFDEDASAQVVKIEIKDNDSEIKCDQLSLNQSSKIDLINIEGSAPNCSANIKSKENINGVEVLTFKVSNALSAEAQLHVNINPVDDKPLFLSVSKAQLSFLENGASQIISLKIKDIDSPLDCGHVSIALNDLVQFSQISQSDSEEGVTCSFGVEPKEYLNGEGKIIISLNNGGMNSKEIPFNIESVIQPPVITWITPPSLFFLEDGASQVVNFKISDVESVATCQHVEVQESSLLSVNLSGGDSQNCSLTITPKKDFNGEGILNLVLNNGAIGWEKISFRVEAVDDAPEIQEVTPVELSFLEDGAAQTVTFSLSDIDSNVSCENVTVGSNSLVDLSLISGGSDKKCGFTVTPKKDLQGKSELFLSVDNGKIGVAKINFNIQGEDDAPIAEAVSGELDEDIRGVITLNYSDVEKDPAELCDLSDLSNLINEYTCRCELGVCQASVQGKENFNGEGSFKFTITSKGKTSNSALATIKINPIDDAPVLTLASPVLLNDGASARSPSLALSEDQNPISVIFNISDVDSPVTCGNLSISSSTLLNLGEITPIGSNSCTTTVTPKNNLSGSETLIVNLSNSSGDNSASRLPASSSPSLNSLELNILVKAEDDAPVVNNQSAFIDEDLEGDVNILFTDVEKDSPTACNISDAINLSLISCGCANNLCTARVKGSSENFNGLGSFKFTVTANGKTSNTAIYSVTVRPLNDLPLINPIVNQSTTAGVVKKVELTGVRDIEDNLSCIDNIQVTSGNSNLVTKIDKAGTAPSCVLNIQTASNIIANASTLINVTVTDRQGGLRSVSFNLEVIRATYDCRAQGFSGPTAPVYSLNECYTDCSSKNLCGGIVYYPNTCTNKTQIELQPTCTKEIIGWKNNCSLSPSWSNPCSYWEDGGGRHFWAVTNSMGYSAYQIRLQGYAYNSIPTAQSIQANCGISRNLTGGCYLQSGNEYWCDFSSDSYYPEESDLKEMCDGTQTPIYGEQTCIKNYDYICK